MTSDDLIEKAKNFQNDTELRKIVDNVLQRRKDFLQLYPFREHPEEIDLLTPDRLYSPGKEDYFFLWIEHKLRNLGHLRIGSAAVWENARDNPERIKELLRAAVSYSLTLSQKVDEHWEDVKGFGGDKQIAKKIIAVYYPEKVFPIFKTEDLEFFSTKAGLDFRKEAIEKYGKSYDMLSKGQSFELFNDILLQFKNKHEEFKKWDNVFFSRFLYKAFPPFRPPGQTRQVKPFHSLGILFEPEYEQEVLYLFSVFHRELGFPYIIRIRNEFPDAIVMNNEKEVKRIEFEISASDFIAHGHDRNGCDFIVCWENDLEEEQLKNLPGVISIKDNVEEFT